MNEFKIVTTICYEDSEFIISKQHKKNVNQKIKEMNDFGYVVVHTQTVEDQPRRIGLAGYRTSHTIRTYITFQQKNI